MANKSIVNSNKSIVNSKKATVTSKKETVNPKKSTSSSKKYIGWFYDKTGNVRYVHYPINALGKKIKPEKKTHCGGLHKDVGFNRIG